MANTDYIKAENDNEGVAVEVKAEFVRQADDGSGNFYDIDKRAFNAVPALDKIPFSSLPENSYNITEDGALNYGDDIYDAAVSVGTIKEWEGPYRVTIIDADAYREYRKRRESYATVKIPRPENCWKCPLRGTWRRARHNEYYCKAVPCGRDREIPNPMKLAAF